MKNRDFRKARKVGRVAREDGWYLRIQHNGGDAGVVYGLALNIVERDKLLPKIVALQRLREDGQVILENFDASLCLCNGEAKAIRGDGPGGDAAELSEVPYSCADGVTAAAQFDGCLGFVGRLGGLVKRRAKQDVCVQENVNLNRHGLHRG
jgi:hypothetical protein